MARPVRGGPPKRCPRVFAAPRLSLAVTAILALVGVVGGAMPGLAQTDRDTYVTGTLDCGLAGDMTVEGDGSVSLERFPGECAAEFSDPRVSGTSESDIAEVCFNEAATSDACILWGATELTGPDGTWAGTWTAIHDESGGLPTWSVMQGSGAYDGWTFVSLTPDQLNAGSSTFGIVYEGPPPPWSESLPLAPAD